MVNWTLKEEEVLNWVFGSLEQACITSYSEPDKRELLKINYSKNHNPRDFGDLLDDSVFKILKFIEHYKHNLPNLDEIGPFEIQLLLETMKASIPIEDYQSGDIPLEIKEIMETLFGWYKDKGIGINFSKN